MSNFRFMMKFGIFVSVALFCPVPELITASAFSGSTPPFAAMTSASSPIMRLVKDMMLLQILVSCACPTLSPT